MLIRHIGHAEFLIETESAVRIVTDPYDAGCGYPIRPVGAEIALVSHHHHDHDAVENLQGKSVIIDQAGLYTPAEGIRITAVRGYHDLGIPHDVCYGRRIQLHDIFFLS